MKVKLLKKIRKRYSWIFNKKGYPVIIDKYTKSSWRYDYEYCLRTFAENDEFKLSLEISKQEWCLRMLKRNFFSQYGYSLDKVFYKYRLRQINKIYKNGKI
jgi:hypothetical protein